MKSEKELRASARAQIKQAQEACDRVTDDLHDLHGMEVSLTVPPLDAIMPRLRQNLARLTKAVHEYNAYRNTLDT
jgi:hypothetical protein